MTKVLLFDTWGTLVDNYSISDVIEQYVFESHLAQRISEKWRFQHKWAMFHLTLSDNFVPHPGLNEACLRWALDYVGVELGDAEIEAINSQYHKLRAYPDVVGALKDMKDQGLTIKIVANPTKAMIEGHSEFAGTRPFIDEIISSGEEAKAFKPSPKVYQLGIERAGCEKDEILWVTGHQWEMFGAIKQGLRCAWTNRQQEPMLPIGIEATYTTKNLQHLADILRAEAN